MSLKPQKIDELLRSEYCFLEDDDRCFFLRERHSGERYDFSETNQLISNLKIPKDKMNRLFYKTRAIEQIAAEIRRVKLKNATVVPVPPSKSSDDPDYDDRLIQILKKVPVSDIRELISQKYSLTPSHQSSQRTSLEDLIDAYEVDESLLLPTPKVVVVFDDMLTTGRHFKAIEKVLRPKLPSAVDIIGLFIARAIHKCPFDTVE